MLVTTEGTTQQSGLQLLEGLNNQQQDAVTASRDGALVILAGPGSGKTRVICHRVAYLIQHEKVNPSNIVFVTFTNKASKEMKHRMEKLLDTAASQRIIMGTFHSTCAFLLRRYAQSIRLAKNFSIIDAQDSKSMIRKILNDHDLKAVQVDFAVEEISRAKNKKLRASDYDALHKTRHDAVVEDMCRCYQIYEAELKKYNHLDFDDLLLYAVQLLKHDRSIAEHFHHVLIDEFQDTNDLQYEITKLLTECHGALTVVGDPDQAIYGWRKADVSNLTKNILRDFEGRVNVVRLSKGYRSTANILLTCHEIISQDELRDVGPMNTNNGVGIPVSVMILQDNEQEAAMAALEIKRLKAATEPLFSYADFSILLRMASMSRSFEKALSTHHIPYKLVGSIRFFERAEVKDILAYLRLAQNPSDLVSFHRIINVPKRNLGEVTLSELSMACDKANLLPLEFLRKMAKGQKSLPSIRQTQHQSLIDFTEVIDDIASLIVAQQPLQHILMNLIDRIKYNQYLVETYHKPEEADSRRANIEELITFASQFDEEQPVSVLDVEEDDQSRSKLQRFLDSTAMGSEPSDSTATATQPSVVISTLHSAKGLEWPVVFVVGVEEKVLPHMRSKDDDQIDEERRLLYVGMTRAQCVLYVSTCQSRWVQGNRTKQEISRFLHPVLSKMDLDPSLLWGSTAAEYHRPTNPLSCAQMDAPWLSHQSISDMSKMLDRSVAFTPRRCEGFFSPPAPQVWADAARAMNNLHTIAASPNVSFVNSPVFRTPLLRSRSLPESGAAEDIDYDVDIYDMHVMGRSSSWHSPNNMNKVDESVYMSRFGTVPLAGLGGFVSASQLSFKSSFSPSSSTGEGPSRRILQATPAVTQISSISTTSTTTFETVPTSEYWKAPMNSKVDLAHKSFRSARILDYDGRLVVPNEPETKENSTPTRLKRSASFAEASSSSSSSSSAPSASTSSASLVSTSTPTKARKKAKSVDAATLRSAACMAAFLNKNSQQGKKDN